MNDISYTLTFIYWRLLVGLALLISACGMPEATAVPTPFDVTFTDPLAEISEGVRLEPPVQGWDGYGEAVAVHDDLLVVGAPEWNYYGPGLAYVYRFSGGQWQEEAQLVASDRAEFIHYRGQRFGSSVAIDNGTIAAGAPGNRDSILAGAVYLFEYDGQTWVETAKLTAGHPDANRTQTEADWPFYNRMKRRAFGAQVALHGDILAAGVEPATDSVYIYQRSASGWQEEARIAIPSLPEKAPYLASLALFGDTLVLSALYLPPPLEQTAFLAGNVIVYVFERNGDGWQERFRFAPEGTADTLFLGEANVGAAVALGGENGRANLLAVGRPGFPDWSEVKEHAGMFGVNPEQVPEMPKSNRQTGAVYIFERGEDGRWNQQATLRPAGWENPPGPGKLFAGGSPATQPEAESPPPPPPPPEPLLPELPPSIPDEQDSSAEAGYFASLGFPEPFVFPGHLFSEDPEISFFGATVALDGNQLAVTAGFANTTYLIERQGENWLYRFRIRPSQEALFWEDFAQVVAIHGRTLLLGTPGEFGNSAYVFKLSPDTTPQ
jgi:hypothetical protein